MSTLQTKLAKVLEQYTDRDVTSTVGDDLNTERSLRAADAALLVVVNYLQEFESAFYIKANEHSIGTNKHTIYSSSALCLDNIIGSMK